MTGAVLRPDTAAQVREAIRDAAGPLVIEGGGGLGGFGRPVQAQATLKLDALVGVVEYSPSELYASFRAGTTLEAARAVLAEKGQRLPFDPPDLTGLYGRQGPATVGGVVAAALSGPARIAAGAARDYLIGVKFVDGVGQALHGGGRVMKNVTGYDLCKLTAGAFGTLGAITEATFKVLPIAPDEVTLALLGLDDAAGQAALGAAFKSPFEPMAAAHLPSAIAARTPGAGGVAGGDRSVTALRLEGFPESLVYRKQAIRAHLPANVDIVELSNDVSRTFWAAVRDVAPFAAPDSRPLWRISTAPTAGPELVRELAAAIGAEAFYDWAGGLIWLAVPANAADAGAAAVRAATAHAGGHATLVRAPEAVRAAIEVFEPLAAAVHRLTQGLKGEFDPDRRLNPSRMYAGV